MFQDLKLIICVCREVSFDAAVGEESLLIGPRSPLAPPVFGAILQRRYIKAHIVSSHGTENTQHFARSVSVFSVGQ